MRVAVILEQCLAAVPGGTGRYAWELAAALASTAAPGDTVEAWTACHRNVTPARVPGVAGPHRLPLGARALALAWGRGRGPAPRRVDLVHAPTPLLPPRRRDQGLVVTLHDAVPWTHPETLTPHGARWHRRMGRRAARTADAVIVPTSAVALALSRQLPAVPLEVVGEGVSATVVQEPADIADRARRLDLPDRFAVFVGTLEPRKGLDVVLAALRRPEWPDLPLLVVGPAGWGGVQVPATTPRADARALGRLSDTDLATVLSRATLLVAPSREEGFGLPVLEALAHGVPAVVSDVPALLEVGGDAVVPVPVDAPPALAQAVAALAGDEPRRHALAAAGRRRAAHYTWAQTARSCWRIYRDALARESPVRRAWARS